MVSEVKALSLDYKATQASRTSFNRGNLAENWKEWIQGFELYLTATEIGEKAEKVQVATFLHVAGIEARRVYNTFEIDEGDIE